MNKPASVPAPLFDYVDEFPSSWENQLSLLLQAGHRSVRIPVRWGAHETAPGIRDLSRSPRLRLEKLFQILQAVGLRAELELGFSPHPETFPAWTRSLKDMSAIPARALYPDYAQYGLVQVPDVYEPTFIEPFWSFADEVTSLVSLYRVPDGPVEQMIFDPGIYAASFPSEGSKVWENFLQQRYVQIARLNEVYGATFKDFASAASRFGTASLAEKRPWICAYDYHGYRQTLLADLKWAAGRKSLQMKEAPAPATPAAEWNVLADMTFSVQYEQKLLPLPPFGGATDIGARSLAVLQEVSELAHEKKFYLRPADPRGELDLPVGKLTVALTGKYLSRAHHRKMLSAIEQGAEVLFLFGLPQYDEELNTLAWPKRSKGREELSLAVSGSGKLWVREFAKSGQPDLWQEIEHNVRVARTV